MKKYVTLPIILLLLMITVIPIFKTSAASTIVAVNPTDSYVTVNKTLSVNVNVTDVGNLTSWQFTVYFLKSILNCTNVVEGPFLQPGGGTFFGNTINNNYNLTHGSVLAYSTLLGSSSVNGSGVLATITFTALAVGDSTLHLSDTKLGDEKIPPQPIAHTTVDGTVHVQNFVLTVSTVGSGNVTLNNTGPYYHYGEAVQLNATASVGWSFSAWSGNLTGSTNPATLVITGNMSVTATFTQDQYTLTITISGSGSVSKSPDQATYTWGTNVTLTANATIGWTFASWSGNASGTISPTTVNMTGNKAVTATFTQNVYTLTTSVIGQGSVSRNNTGPLHYGDVVLLTANASVGWSFSLWSGGLGGSANPATLTITGDVSVNATFTQNTYTLSVTANPVGSGSVDLNNSGPYYYGDVVQLTAVPTIGWTFDHWSGDALGATSPTTVSITGNKVVTANFAQNNYTLVISTIGSGSVTPNASGPYHYGDSVVLNASALTGWVFQFWTGNLTGSTNPATIIMTGNFSVTANFIQKPGLQMTPASKTCRIYGETFTVAINVSNAVNVTDFAFEIHFNTTLLDYFSVTWGTWGSGIITIDEGNGVLTGYTNGTAFNGTRTLITLGFKATFYHIWKVAPGWTNNLTDTIFIQKANISYSIGPDLRYEKAGVNQITVGPDFLYTFAPIQGDVNNDGIVDLFDLVAVAHYFDVKLGDPLWPAASAYDLDGNGAIDVFDLRVIAANYGYTYTP